MALIPCYECEKEISDKAPACPQCGAPRKKAPSKKKVAPKKKSAAPKKKTTPKKKAAPKTKSARDFDRKTKSMEQIFEKLDAKHAAQAKKRARQAKERARQARKKSSAPKKKAAVRVDESIPVGGDDFMEQVMTVIIMIYFGGWGLATLYEEAMFFVEEGFVVWILFGWVVPMFRALLWPLNVYQALVG